MMDRRSAETRHSERSKGPHPLNPCGTAYEGPHPLNPCGTAYEVPNAKHSSGAERLSQPRQRPPIPTFRSPAPRPSPQGKGSHGQVRRTRSGSAPFAFRAMRSPGKRERALGVRARRQPSRDGVGSAVITCSAGSCARRWRAIDGDSRSDTPSRDGLCTIDRHEPTTDAGHRCGTRPGATRATPGPTIEPPRLRMTKGKHEGGAHG
jgi:hypothetical protein